MPTKISFQETRGRIAAAFQDVDADGLWPAPDLSCRVLPGWVGEFGAARCDDGWLVYLAPGPDPEPDRAGMSQAVIDVPAGRYLVDVHDIAARTWRSRESAAAPPLVIGVPAADGPVVLTLTRVVVAAH